MPIHVFENGAATFGARSELARELTALEAEFARWRDGSINVHDLGERIHEFHQGPNRRLFMTYTGSTIELDLLNPAGGASLVAPSRLTITLE